MILKWDILHNKYFYNFEYYISNARLSFTFVVFLHCFALHSVVKDLTTSPTTAENTLQTDQINTIIIIQIKTN